MNTNKKSRAVHPTSDKLSAPARPRRRWWHWTLRAFLAVLVLLGLLAWYYAHRRHEALEVVRAAVAELDQTESGWRLHEIEAARAVVPEDQNSARVMTEA